MHLTLKSSELNDRATVSLKPDLQACSSPWFYFRKRFKVPVERRSRTLSPPSPSPPVASRGNIYTDSFRDYCCCHFNLSKLQCRIITSYIPSALQARPLLPRDGEGRARFLLGAKISTGHACHLHYVHEMDEWSGEGRQHKLSREETVFGPQGQEMQPISFLSLYLKWTDEQLQTLPCPRAPLLRYHRHCNGQARPKLGCQDQAQFLSACLWLGSYGLMTTGSGKSWG